MTQPHVKVIVSRDLSNNVQKIMRGKSIFRIRTGNLWNNSSCMPGQWSHFVSQSRRGRKGFSKSDYCFSRLHRDSKSGERSEHARAIFCPCCANFWSISTDVLSFGRLAQLCYLPKISTDVVFLGKIVVYGVLSRIL